MTDTLKPAELDLEALKKVALEATPGPRVVWSSLYEHMDAQLRTADGTVEGVALAEYYRLSNGFKNATFAAVFDPPTVLSLLTRIEALEAERDEALMIAEGPSTLRELASLAIENAHARYAAEARTEAARNVAPDDDGLCHLLREVAFSYDCEDEDFRGSGRLLLREALGRAELLSESRRVAEAQRDRMREALDWLSARTNLSLEWNGPDYGDDDEPEEWRVYREYGGINDREWETVGSGATALDAILAARAALSQGTAGARSPQPLCDLHKEPGQ